jgi:hypothetical protein
VYVKHWCCPGPADQQTAGAPHRPGHRAGTPSEPGSCSEAAPYLPQVVCNFTSILAARVMCNCRVARFPGEPYPTRHLQISGAARRSRDVAVLAPSVRREIHWRLLNGPQAPLVRQIDRADSRRIAAPYDVAAIGYDSPSQFSREYRRMFGAPPGQDATASRPWRLSRSSGLRAGRLPFADVPGPAFGAQRVTHWLHLPHHQQ